MKGTIDTTRTIGIKNVLLTGAGGKIGGAALPELVKAGFSVRALEYDDGLGVEKLDGVEIVTGDMRDETLAPKLIENMDAVIHLTNVKGTFYLLDACKQAGHIKQYIQAGSDARAGIYYHPRPVPICAQQKSPPLQVK